MNSLSIALTFTAIAWASPVFTAPAMNMNATDSSVFVSPSPIDASRDAVNNTGLPGAQGGAWVSNNSVAAMGDANMNRNQPLVANNVVPAIAPMAFFDSFGAVINTENLTSAANARPAVMQAAVPQAAIAKASGMIPQAQGNMFANNDMRVKRDVPAVGQPMSTASVQTIVGSQQVNQSFATGDGPIVAVLPAGSNFSATWDLNSGASPTIRFASIQQTSTPSSMAMPPVVLVAAQSESTSTSTVSTSQIAETSSGVDSQLVKVPMILPVGVPINANQSILDASAPVLVGGGMVASNGGAQVSRPVVDSDRVVIQQNHRIEFQLIDLQMNNSANTVLIQNIAVSVRVTAGVITPAAAVNQNLSVIGAPNNLTPVMAAPETTSGVQQVFNGTYNTSIDNKVHVGRTITQDLCGQISDKAFMTVVIQPLSNADAPNFPQQQSYTCVINLNFPTAVRSTESFWSDTLQCNSGLINGFSYRLWYRVRQYNIDWANCQQNRPNPISLS
ncbi:hypothetical protein BV898_16024 [Hypsibius exemplaris]|uniref:Uncharacterized protein n=1 Tax=Hypsibius exemplaris TaxID=2072580 RepID=A0A9X6RL37_HYPEX|nr:hypothetical protein BV898_16024 [Hypsibius exemplaris]